MDAGTNTRPMRSPIRLGIFAVLTLALALTCGISAAQAFSDVPPSHPYYDAITHLSEEGIVSGYPRRDLQARRTVLAAALHQDGGSHLRTARL